MMSETNRRENILIVLTLGIFVVLIVVFVIIGSKDESAVHPDSTCVPPRSSYNHSRYSEEEIKEPERLRLYEKIYDEFPCQGHQLFPPYCEQVDMGQYVSLIGDALFPYRHGISWQQIEGTPETARFVIENGKLYGHEKRPNHIRIAFSSCLKDIAPYLYNTVLPMRTDDHAGVFNSKSLAFGFCRRNHSLDLLLPYAYMDYAIEDVPWEAKKPIVMWRGSPNTPLRKALIKFSRQHPDVLDVGCVNTTSDQSGMDPLCNSTAMSLEDQMKQYRYTLVLDGHCASIRLESTLASSSLNLLMEGGDELWFSPLLRPNVTHVEVPADYEHRFLSLLTDIETHQERYKKIAEHGKTRSQLFDWTRQKCYSALLVQAYTRLLTFRPPAPSVSMVQV